MPIHTAPFFTEFPSRKKAATVGARINNSQYETRAQKYLAGSISPKPEPAALKNQAASADFTPFAALSIRATTSSRLQTWSATPASIAGVTRNV